MRVNLIPTERIRARQQGRRIRLWSTGLAAYAFFLVVALIVTRVIGSSDDRYLRVVLEQAKGDVVTAETKLQSLQQEQERAALLLTANRAIGNQPDWGVLLALLADTTAGEVVLRDCRITSRVVSAPETIEPMTRVQVSGLGRTQRSVSQYLLRMEDVPLFTDVKLQDTRLEPFLDGSAVTFRLDLDIDAGGEH
jgi:Tfp pilus assembly protein PilN